jgi:hypothetical protein
VGFDSAEVREFIAERLRCEGGEKLLTAKFARKAAKDAKSGGVWLRVMGRQIPSCLDTLARWNDKSLREIKFRS